MLKNLSDLEASDVGGSSSVRKDFQTLEDPDRFLLKNTIKSGCFKVEANFDV